MSFHGGQYAEPPPVNPPVTPSPSLLVPSTARSGYGSYGKKVTISPEVTSKTKSRDIMKFLSGDSFGSSHLDNLLFAHDGKKSAFAAGPLSFDSKEFAVNLTQQNGREREFKVTIKFAAMKELDHPRQFLAGRQQDNPQETIQALDVVLRESASRDREEVGRSLFHTDVGRGPLGDGIEYWKGFYQSLQPTQMGLSLNIDMSARAFYEPKLLSEFVGEFLGKDMSRPLNDQDTIKVKRALKGVRVEVRCQNYKRRYKVQGLTAQPISQLNFIDETGTTKTVVEYFREKYNVQLRFPFLPAVQAGTDAKPTYLSMEICWVVPGQRYALKLNERQVTQFLRATCQRPKDREDSIDNTMKHNKYNEDPLVSEDFEMNVTELLTSIEARVLPPPPLRYHESGRSSDVHPSVGVWNMIDLKVINGGTVNYWAVINFSRQNEQAVGRFVNGIVSMCQTKGIVCNPQPLIRMMHAAPHNIEKALVDIQFQCSAQLAKIAPGHQLQMLFVILPDAKGAHPRIKRVCETELGIVSQCCKPQHIMKMSNQYFENVALKINVKVGGRNTVLSATSKATISPEVTSKTKSRDIMEFLTKSYRASHLGNLMLAYDGKKSAFAAGPLPFESKEFVVKITEQNGREREFKVSIKFAAKKDLPHLREFLQGCQQDLPQETMQALDVVLRESASKGREIIGRSLFSPEMGIGPLGDGIEFWKGFYQSLRPTQMGLSLNIDMSARAFYEERLVSDFVGEFLGRDISRPLSDQERIKVKGALRGVRVEVHRNDYMRRYKVQAVTPQPISQLKFVDETGATKTVVQYFREKYSVQTRFPSLPAIQAGNDAKPIYLPMETCRIAKGQKYGLKLNEKQVTQFLRATCQRLQARENSIRDMKRELRGVRVDVHHKDYMRRYKVQAVTPQPTSQLKREREFKVTIKFAARKELDHQRHFLAGRQQDNPKETIQALDVVLRESASKDRVIVGRSLFHTDFGRGPLGDGIEYWKGFYQSLRPKQMGLSLNIDMSARAFYETKLLSKFVGEFLGRDMSRPLSDQERIKVKRALKSSDTIRFLSGGGKRKLITQHLPLKDDDASGSSSSILIELLPSTLRGKLLERIDRLNLKLEGVKGDGACQYRAVARAIKGNQDEHRIVKSELMQEMKENPYIYMALGSAMKYEGMRTISSFNDFVDRLKPDKAWGGYLTLYAVCNRYNCRVNIVCSIVNENMVVLKELTPTNRIAEKEIFLSYIALGDKDAHYDALVPRDDSIDSPPGPPCVQIMLMNLPDFVTQCELNKVFKVFGKVKSSNVIKKLGMGFVEMKKLKEGVNLNDIVNTLDGDEEVWYNDKDAGDCTGKKPRVQVVEESLYDINGERYAKSYRM